MNGGADAFEPVVTDDGSITFAHPRHGQTYHSRAGAWAESRLRYAEACDVRARVAQVARTRVRGAGAEADGGFEASSTAGFDAHLDAEADSGADSGAAGASAAAVRVLDVGTGLGLNLAALVHAARQGIADARCAARDLSSERPCVVVHTLEHDERVLRAALALGPQPLPELEMAHAPVRAALSAALAARAPVALAEVGTLELVMGDAARALAALAPDPEYDVVFLDPFSPSVEPELWRPAVLARIARRLAPGGVLTTYTASAGVRAALLAAGLAVGPLPHGLGKSGGTIARRGGNVPAFPPDVAAKLARRAARVAAELDRADADA